MNLSERILLTYLGYVLILALVLPIAMRRRVYTAGLALAAAVVLIVVPRLPPSRSAEALRAILPLAGVLWSYFLSAAFFTAPQDRMEARFQAFDRRVRRWMGVEDLDRRAPRALLEFLELSYVACYAVPIAGFMTVIAAGQFGQIDRFWSVVVLAEVASYGMLPWIRTRPGWVVRPNAVLDRRRLFVRRINLFLVRHTSIRRNTFPSGHVSGALATALALASIVPHAVPVFLILAIAIAAGSVSGDYHYAGDAIAGAATAVAAWGILTAVWG